MLEYIILRYFDSSRFLQIRDDLTVPPKQETYIFRKSSRSIFQYQRYILYRPDLYVECYFR